MTPHLPVVTAKQLSRVAEKLGYELDRQKGSHAIYYRESDKTRIVIPVHSGKTIKPKTLIGILSDMGLTPDDLREML